MKVSPLHISPIRYTRRLQWVLKHEIWKIGKWKQLSCVRANLYVCTQVLFHVLQRRQLFKCHRNRINNELQSRYFFFNFLQLQTSHGYCWGNVTNSRELLSWIFCKQCAKGHKDLSAQSRYLRPAFRVFHIHTTLLKVIVIPFCWPFTCKKNWNRYLQLYIHFNQIVSSLFILCLQSTYFFDVC